MAKGSGFDGLAREMEDAAKFGKALKSLKVECDLMSPASVEEGIRRMEEKVDREAARYRGNKIVQVTADGAKQALREGVRKEAAKAQKTAK